MVNTRGQTVGAMLGQVVGFELFEVNSTSHFLKCTQAYHFDCFIINVSVVGKPIAEVIHMVKSLAKNAGLILMSYTNQVQDRIEALRLGADDFLLDPFEPEELVIRTKALADRLFSLQKKSLVFKEIKVLIDSKSVLVSDRCLDLTKTEFELLRYFVERPDIPVKHEALVTYLATTVTHSKAEITSIYTHLKNLRKKLRQAKCGPYLRTLYGVGYCFSDVPPKS